MTGGNPVRGIMWFRRDLRVHDQPALTAALAECDEVIPLFVFDRPLLRSQQFGSACVNFMLGCLRELGGALAKHGLRLTWRQGDPVEEVVKAARDVKADVVYWNRDYEPSAVERDRTVARQLAASRIAVRTFKDHVVFEAHEIRSASGGPLQRYSAYRARWWAQWRAAAPPVLPPPSRRAGSSGMATIELPTSSELGYGTVLPTFPAGETEARRRLQWFLDGPVREYGTGRNRPAVDGTSKLSPHFRFGTLSPRSAVHAALTVLSACGVPWRAGIQTWVDELVWRDFFQQILASFPRVAIGPFRPNADALPPRRDARLFCAWREGRTGFPLVDAGMRQLNRTGWMHNRVRMVVASFLVKDLRLDWRQGERYFMEHLLDADLAANNGNWQWCASTGTDAMPGYRIFNPTLQAKKFDPDGDYIRAHVPELRSLPAKLIHQPEIMTADEQTRYNCRVGLDYPKPVVNHERARDEYLRAAR
jgi:deoxyribodipyrimidine photo-lyase